MSYRLTGELSVEGACRRCGLHGMMAQNEFNSGAINAAMFVEDRFSKVYEQCAGAAGGYWAEAEGGGDSGAEDGGAGVGAAEQDRGAGRR